MGKEITFDKFIRWAGVTLIVLAVLYMTNYLSSVLLPFFIAWFFAYLLYPVVKFIENKLHVKIRALSILIAMGTAIAVIGGVLWLIIPPMIDQFDKLGEVLTRWLHQTTHTNNLTALIKDWLQANQEQIEHFLKSKDFSDAIKTTMPKVFSVVSQTATVLMSIVASMITLLYMTLVNYGTNDIGHVGDGGSRSGSQIQHLASRLHEDVADTSLCSSAERQRPQSQQRPTWSGRGSTVCIPSFRRSFPVHQSTQLHPTGTSTEIFFSP